MKIFYMLLLCLYVTSSYSQTRPQENTNGNYVFQKATFSLYNYDTQAEIESRVITDLASLDVMDVIFRNVFAAASVVNDQLIYCELSDGNKYSIENDTDLTIVPESKVGTDSNIKENIPVQLTPYSLQIKGNTLIFTVNYVLGDSRYDFTLAGKLILTMTKEK